ncbi:MAG TPA: hypothetical protein PKW79_05340, partial [Rhabdochlamydiaceae bacterium]|nr:hypothetical protein [Rhabdochlamydiaceae bacterium]
MGTVHSFLSYYSLVQPPKESETLRQAIVKIHSLADYERDTLYLRSSAAVVYSLFVATISALDAISYLARIPMQFTNSIIAFEFKTGVLSIGHNVANTANSLKLSVLLVLSAVSGIFLPYYAFKLLPDTRPAHQIAEEGLAELNRQLVEKQRELDGIVSAAESHRTITARSVQLEEERADLERRVVLIRGEHQRLNALCLALARQKEELERQTSGEAIEEIKRQAATARDLLAEHQHEIGRLEELEGQLAPAIEELQRNSEQLTREKAQAQEQLDGALGQLREQTEALRQLGLQKDEVLAQIEQTQRSIAKLEEQKGRLTQAVKGLREESERLTHENGSAQEKLNAALVELRAQEEKLERAIAAEKQSIEEAAAPARLELEKLRQQIQTASNEKAELEGQSTDLRRGLEELSQEKAAVAVDHEEAERTKAFLAEHSPKARELTAQLEALKKECAEAERRKKKIEGKVAQIQEQIPKAREALGVVEKAKDGYVRELKAAAAKITLLQQGISEKVRELEVAILPLKQQLEALDRPTQGEQ